MAKRPPRRHSKLKNLFIAHAGNGYHPHLFRRTALIVFALVIVVFEGAYVLDTQILQNREGFLASVLPAALLDLTNADRASNGIAPLINDSQLAKAAQLKANDMAAKGYFAHVSPEGKTPWYWLDSVGYQYTYAGENLAINYDDSSAVEAAWMNSPTHRANIVKSQYTRVGYAVAQGTYDGRPTTFVVQEFATKPTDETVTATPKQSNPVASVVSKVVAVVKPAEEMPATQTTKPRTQTTVRAGGVSVERGAPSKQSEPAPQTGAGENPANTGQPMILGTHDTQTTTSSSPIKDFFVRITASPLSTSVYVLGGLSILMLLLLGFALVSHAQVRYLEVLSGGLIVIIFALSVLTYNVLHTAAPILPGEAAAITAAK